MDDRLLGPLERVEGALDQVVAGLGQDLDRHVVGDQVLVDQEPQEVVVGLGGRGEPHLDLFESQAHQELEHGPLLGRVHGLDQRLVAVAQVDAAPDRRLGDGSVGPLPVRNGNRRIGPVLLDGHSFHGLVPILVRPGSAGEELVSSLE
jgi:hypothetical protein